MKEDENEYELKNVKEKLYNFIHRNKEIEKSMDEIDQARDFITNITNENIISELAIVPVTPYILSLILQMRI